MLGISSQSLLTSDMGYLLSEALVPCSLNFQTFKLVKDTLKFNKPTSAICLKDGPGHPAFRSYNSGSRVCDHKPRNHHSTCPNLFLLFPTRFAAHQKQWPQNWKRSVFIPIPKKDNAKECSHHCTIALISHASKVILKNLQARLQQFVNRELYDVQAGFTKGRGTRDQIANIRWIIEKARDFLKNIYFCFIDYSKAFELLITINGKLFKRWEYQTT